MGAPPGHELTIDLKVMEETLKYEGRIIDAAGPVYDFLCRLSGAVGTMWDATDCPRFSLLWRVCGGVGTLWEGAHALSSVVTAHEAAPDHKSYAAHWLLVAQMGSIVLLLACVLKGLANHYI